MERLTCKTKNVNGNDCYIAKVNDIPTYDHSHYADIINKLGEYEDLGVTPEQLRQVDDFYRQRCEELNELEGQLCGAIELIKNLINIIREGFGIEDGEGQA